MIRQRQGQALLQGFLPGVETALTELRGGQPTITLHGFPRRQTGQPDIGAPGIRRPAIVPQAFIKPPHAFQHNLGAGVVVREFRQHDLQIFQSGAGFRIGGINHAQQLLPGLPALVRISLLAQIAFQQAFGQRPVALGRCRARRAEVVGQQRILFATGRQAGPKNQGRQQQA